MANDSVIRVLIVDDHEAVDMVRKPSPDIVVMDIRMPNMNGIQATKIIAGLPRPCKVIVLTNHDQLEYVDLAIEAGASGRRAGRSTTNWRTEAGNPAFAVSANA